MPTEKQIRVAALAMMADLQKLPREGGEHGCLLLFEPKLPENVCVRGHIDLEALALAALTAVERAKK